MFAGREVRTPRGAPYREPRGFINWHKAVRLGLYGLLGLLVLSTALGVGLLLVGNGPTAGTPSPAALAPPPQATVPLPEAPPPPVSPQPATPQAAAPQADAASAAASSHAVAPDQPTAQELAALRSQVQDAADTLAALRSATDEARAQLAELGRQRDTIQQALTAQQAQTAQPIAPPAPAPAPSAPAASEAANGPAPASPTPASPTPASPTSASPSPTPAAAVGASKPSAQPSDAELRTVLDRLARQRQEKDDATDAAARQEAQRVATARAVPTPSPPPPPARAVPPPSQPAFASEQQRPRVFINYRAGSGAGEDEAADLAHRMLFSDFAYAETRHIAGGPWAPTIRYFHSEDAGAASRLADLLRDNGEPFRIQDMTHFHARPPRGTLEVWVGR